MFVSFIVYQEIERKLLEKHGVTVLEVEEAFYNLTGEYAREVRPMNHGEHPRYWFISKTNAGHRLKVVFVDDPEETRPVLITAYNPNEEEEELYASL
ncbi:MAG: hypothetical protein KA715_10305 [Xanthomonadaceae bacterium]|nr:hypothetical protein [Xanthomonadaceae bacterium]